MVVAKEKHEMIVAEIRKLSQEEGLTDAEVASLLGYSVSAITKLRIQNNIPKRNIFERKDKINECKRCGKLEYIRRKQRKRILCDGCRNG